MGISSMRSVRSIQLKMACDFFNPLYNSIEPFFFSVECCGQAFQVNLVFYFIPRITILVQHRCISTPSTIAVYSCNMYSKSYNIIANPYLPPIKHHFFVCCVSFAADDEDEDDQHDDLCRIYSRIYRMIYTVQILPCCCYIDGQMYL